MLPIPGVSHKRQALMQINSCSTKQATAEAQDPQITESFEGESDVFTIINNSGEKFTPDSSSGRIYSPVSKMNSLTSIIQSPGFPDNFRQRNNFEPLLRNTNKQIPSDQNTKVAIMPLGFGEPAKKKVFPKERYISFNQSTSSVDNSK